MTNILQGNPFNLKGLLFDLILCIATLFLGEIVAAIICIAWTESREEGLGKSVLLAIPLGTILFYIIRRRFNALITIIQIVVTTVTTISFGYLAIKLSDYLPHILVDIDYWVVFITTFITFVLTKHLSDVVVFNRTKST